MGRMNGKRVLVTGASSGIGRAVANRFAAEGAAVAAAGRDEARTTRTVAEITANGGSAFALLGDVASEDGARSVVEGPSRSSAASTLWSTMRASTQQSGRSSPSGTSPSSTESSRETCAAPSWSPGSRFPTWSAPEAAPSST